MGFLTELNYKTIRNPTANNVSDGGIAVHERADNGERLGKVEGLHMRCVAEAFVGVVAPHPEDYDKENKGAGDGSVLGFKKKRMSTLSRDGSRIIIEKTTMSRIITK